MLRVSKIRNWIGGITIFLLFIILVTNTIKLGMHKEPSMWAVDAMPPVLSKMWFGHEINYTTLKEVRSKFYSHFDSAGSDLNKVNKTLKHIKHSKINDLENYEILGNDDKGIIDFVSCAFKTFGTKAESILTLYLILLGISCCVFTLCFHKSKAHLFILALFLAMLSYLLPSLKYNPQLSSLMALRVFPLLSIVACLHCLSYLFDTTKNDKSNGFDIFAIILQLSLMYFVLHIRTTTMWQLYIVALTAILLLYKETLKSIKIRPSIKLQNYCIKKPLTILAIIILGYIGLKTYRYSTFPKEYLQGKQIVTRVFWHNIFSGFALHPNLADKYKLRIDDMSIIDATGEFLKEEKRWDDWSRIGGDVSYDIRWAYYDQVVAEMLFRRCLQHKKECAETFLIYKPISLIGNLRWLYGYEQYPPDAYVLVSRHFGDVVEKQFKETSELLDINRGRMKLFGVLPIGIFIIFSILIIKYEQKYNNLKNAAKAVIMLGIGASIPSLIGYPGAHVIAEFATIAPIIFYIICLILLFNFSIMYKQMIRKKLLY